MSYSLAIRAGALGDVQTSRLELGIRVALPIVGGLLTTSGILLAWRKNPLAPWLVVTGALLSAVVAGGEVLEAAQQRGRLS